MIRVFIADDHAVVREGLSRILGMAEDIRLVGEAADARTTILKCREDPPDVLVLDVSLPEGGGSEVIRQLSKDVPDVRIVVYSMYAEEQYGAPMMRAGAAAYLSKHRSTEELLEAIRRCARGRRYVTETVAERLLAAPGDAATPLEALSERETQVLQLLAEGLTTSDIASQLFLSQSTVSTHLKHIRQKLGLRTRGEIVQYAYRQGLSG